MRCCVLQLVTGCWWYRTTCFQNTPFFNSCEGQAFYLWHVLCSHQPTATASTTHEIPKEVLIWQLPCFPCDQGEAVTICKFVYCICFTCCDAMFIITRILTTFLCFTFQQPDDCETEMLQMDTSMSSVIEDDPKDMSFSLSQQSSSSITSSSSSSERQVEWDERAS